MVKYTKKEREAKIKLLPNLLSSFALKKKNIVTPQIIEHIPISGPIKSGFIPFPVIK